jgi:hypothetical protein
MINTAFLDALLLQHHRFSGLFREPELGDQIINGPNITY